MNASNILSTPIHKPTTPAPPAPSSQSAAPQVTSSPKLSGKIRSMYANASKNVNHIADLQSNQQQQHQQQQQQQHNHHQQHISRRNMSIPSKTPLLDTTVQLQPKQDTQEFSMDNYYNFNTLAAVAAASPSISPSRNMTVQQQKLYPLNIEHNEEAARLG